jgi:hypothetical protein
MTDTDRAKAMLPDMPDEVFDLWIRHCVSKSGWPYDSIHDTGDEYWKGYFLGRPLAVIRNLEWEKTSIQFRLSMLERPTQEMLHKMKLLDHDKLPPACVGAMVPADSILRYESAKAFIKEEQKIPGFLVLLRTSHGFQIFDGWHRLTAIYALQESLPPLELPCWIAS